MQRLTSAILGTLLLLAPLEAQHSALPEAAPMTAGFSAERLKRLNVEMRRMVDQQEIPGIVMLTARHGKIVDSDVYGSRDLAAATPLTRDSIFRIYSMTKPVTGVAMMMLYEEGKWQLERSGIALHPGVRKLKVYAGKNDDGTPKLEDARRSMTMRELMTHTGGLGYASERGESGRQDVSSTGTCSNRAAPLQIMIDGLAKLPLLAQPGTRWSYSIAVDVQGYLIEKFSGMTLRGLRAHADLRAARHEGHRVLGPGEQAPAPGHGLRVRRRDASTRSAAPGSEHHEDAGDAVWRGRPLFDRG